MSIRRFLYCMLVVGFCLAGSAVDAQFHLQQTAGARPELVLQSGLTSPAVALAFSPDGRLLVSMSVLSGTIKLWDTSNGRELRALYPTGSGMGESSHAFSFSRDGKLLVAVSAGRIDVWETATGREISSFMLPRADQIGASFVVSPDARLLAMLGQAVRTGPDDTEHQTIRIWEAQTGRMLSTISLAPRERALGGAMTFSPDGALLAVVSENNEGRSQKTELKLLNTSTGKEQHRIKTSEDKISMSNLTQRDARRSLMFSFDGRFVGMAIRDSVTQMSMSMPSAGQPPGANTVKFWEVNGGREVFSVDAPNRAQKQTLVEKIERSLQNFDLSPDGKVVAVSDNDQAVMLYDFSSGRQLNSIAGHKALITSVAFSRDNRQLAISDLNNELKLWDVQTARDTLTLGRGSAQPITDTLFSADGRSLLTAGRASLNIWDLNSGGALRVLKLSEKTQSKWTPDELPSILSDDGSLFAMPDAKNTSVVLWEAKSGRELRRFALPAATKVNGIALSANNQTLGLSARLSAQASNTNTLPQGQTPMPFPMPSIPKSEKRGKQPPVMSIPGMDMSKMKEMMEAAQRGDMGKVMEQMGGMMSGILGMPAPSMGNLRLMEVGTGRELRTMAFQTSFFTQAADRPETVAFSPEGGRVANTSGTNIKIWNAGSGEELRTISTERAMFLDALTFSPDGRHIVAASNFELDISVNPMSADPSVLMRPDSLTYTVRMWEAETGRLVQTLGGHKSMITALAFSPDGRVLASAGIDGKIILWEAATGKQVRTFGGRSLFVRALAFSVNGKLLVSGGEDGSVRLWETETGEELATLVNLNQGSDWLVVTPDGLFDGSPAGFSQILWRFSPDNFDVLPVEAFFNEFYYPGLLGELTSGKRPRASSNIINRDRRQPQLALTPEPSGGSGAISTERNVTVRISVTDAPAGAKDLRLFRNGSLVRVWRGDAFKLSAQDGCAQASTGQVACTATVPIVAGANHFTAYAFNKDDVKSVDAQLSVTGADSLKRKGTAYLIAVGVNDYANKDFSLKYAVPDAELFVSETLKQQSRLGNYANVEIIPLQNSEATKENILLALKRLAGKDTNALPPSAPAVLQKLKPSQPEDAVVLYFSGHGLAYKDRFLLIPYDLGYMGPREVVNETQEQFDKKLALFASHGISDLDLEAAFAGIDAGQFVLVIDACNSGQALEAEEKRRGPMNSKGLAQLAYEKGMSILTAALGYQEAIAPARLGHGYLTYALMTEGLQQAKADGDPKDGLVLLREWLDFATERVPALQDDGARERRIVVQEQKKTQTDASIAAPASTQPTEPQRPRVFYRREADTQPLIVARP